MPRLRLILGPPGSGKTALVLSEAAALAAAAPLPSPDAPPVLLIVPEQQVATIERAVLERLADVHGCPANARVQVISLSRLGLKLAQEAGIEGRPLSDLGRRLLVWSLLPPSDDRAARAAVLSELVAELAHYGTAPGELRSRAEALPPDSAGAEPKPGSLAAKLSELAALSERYAQVCSERGLAFAPPVVQVSELLITDSWPGLDHTEIYLDGFAGFTPAEERALKALLINCSRLSCTLCLERQRLSAPLARDTQDWYAPTRELYARLAGLAAGCGAQLEERWLEDTPRWGEGNPLRRLAAAGGAGQADDAPPDPPGAPLSTSFRATVHAGEREEVEAAAREIARLTRPPELDGLGLRFSGISLVTRSLETYADLVTLAFAAHGIPCFIDRRAPLKHHPAAELLRSGVRLALGLAGEEDVYALLKTDLLPGGAEARARVDELERYAREQGLKPYEWLEQAPWRRMRELLYAEEERLGPEGRAGLRERLARYDAWRRELLAPVLELAHAWRALPPEEQTLKALLGLAWKSLITPAVAAELERWSATQAPADGTPAPDAHRQVLPALAELLDELAAVAGGECPPAGELCAWLEYGLGELTLGHAPPYLDGVLVTEIERGRQHEMQASLLLGMALDSWPPAPLESPFIADADRLLVNAQAPLLAPGVCERAAREPYLALVAATRPARYLYISRPAADTEGRLRPPSPFFDTFCKTLGAEPASQISLAAPATIHELILLAGLHPASRLLAEAAAETGSPMPAALAALAWARAQAADAFRRRLLEPSPYAPEGQDKPLLAMTASRLEAFAACPFKHYARYLLHLEEPSEPGLSQLEIGGFMHRILERSVARLLAEGCDWRSLDAIRLRAVLLEEAQGQTLRLSDESGRLRAAYTSERAQLLLGHFAQQLLETIAATGRVPAAAELHFGGAQAMLPPLTIELTRGAMRLSGMIDRLDVDTSGAALVTDYKLGKREVKWPLFLAGAQLQLFVYLLAVAEQSIPGAAPGMLLKPQAAAYQPLEPDWDEERASFAPHLVPPAMKNENKRAALEPLLENVLGETRRILHELGERLLAGEITVAPLREPGSRGYIACTGCPYRALCRFDPAAGDAYRELPVQGNAALRDALAAGTRYPGSALPGGGQGGAQ